MREPKNNTERKSLKDSCVASYKQEYIELQDKYGCSNVEDFYYSDHLGSWILTLKNGDDQEFETKEEMMDWIKSEACQP